MKRVQISLTEDQIAALRDLAASTGTAVAAQVREAVDVWIARQRRDELWDRALAAVGTAPSGLGDLAENHDKYLGEDGEW